MIPMIVCQTGSTQAWATSVAFAIAAVACGVLVARYRGRLGRIAACVGASILAMLPPVLAISGMWPFDPSWRADCGATPSPNVEVLYTVMALPLLAAVSCWIAVGKRQSS